jgi:hypothetical protein
MSNFTFDGVNRIIYGNYVVNYGSVSLDVQRDLYSEWKRWVQEDDNAKFLQAFSTTGGDPISPTISVGSYFFLENDWKIYPNEEDHRLVLNGNLYTRDDSSPFLGVPGFSIVTETRNSSLTQTVTSGGSSREDIYEYFTTDGREEPFKADTSLLGTKDDLEVINRGVKKASKLIPHNEDLP